MYINNIAKKKDLFHKPFFFLFKGGKCYVHTQLFLACTCVYLFLVSPVAIFRTGFPFVEYCSGSSGPFYCLITRNYATDFNMNFLEVSLLL